MVTTILRVEDSDLTAVRAFKNTVRGQLETRFKLNSEGFTESIPIVACMLDPRFKHLRFIPDEKREAAYSHLKTLLPEDEEAPSETGAGDDEPGHSHSEGKKARLEQDFEQLFGPIYSSGKGDVRHSNAAKELQQYLLLPHIPTMENPLQWWSRNQKHYPRLAKLCKAYLAVPATSTPSERIFSLAGNTITRQRTSLHPSHVDVLIFLHENMGIKTPKTAQHDLEWDSE
ncbi:hypothetical protein WMY93_006992 [Mugilogobius chulae]